MDHPWKEISLEVYEAHMSLASVQQLQTMNSIMKDQFEEYPVSTAMVFGVAGGNGIEHVDPSKYETVYGIDINEDYLRVAEGRFEALRGVLKLLAADLTEESLRLPHADLIIANLLIEYTGYGAFQRAVRKVDPAYVSCVLQINEEPCETIKNGAGKWVSESPYLHAFDGLDAIHHQIDERGTVHCMDEIGYGLILRETYALPNGKSLLRLDFKRTW